MVQTFILGVSRKLPKISNALEDRYVTDELWRLTRRAQLPQSLQQELQAEFYRRRTELFRIALLVGLLIVGSLGFNAVVWNTEIGIGHDVPMLVGLANRIGMPAEQRALGAP